MIERNDVTAFNGYPLSILLAVLLHGSVVGALLFFQGAETQVIEIVQPPSVKANLVGENPQARNQQVQEQKQAQRVQDQRAEQRREEERRQAQARETEQRAQQQRQQEAERQTEQKRVAQLERERDAQRQSEQQRAKEQKQREDQAKAEQARRRQQELAAQQQRQNEAQAQADQAAQQTAAADGEAVMSYTALIHDLVQKQWSRPPSARNGMVAVLRIRMVPTGDIIDVEIVRSSGDFAFDRAAESAVFKVNRFTELQGMPTRLFDRNFRSFLLTFRPEDLLN
jgi:colicin import membrane protein